MKAVIACGGTGGHVFPGISVGRSLRRRGHEVSLWVGGRGVENASVGDWDGPVVRVEAAGFPTSPGWSALRAAWLAAGAIRASRRHMKDARPDVVLGMGSYASVGPVCAARTLGIPVVLHEANAIPGRAISVLSRLAAAAAVSFEETVAHIRGCAAVVTGFPVREDLGGTPFGEPLVRDGFTVLVMGGSQGAHRLNEVATEAICRLRGEGMPVQAVHLTGPADERFVRGAYQAAGVPHVVEAFLREIGRAYRSASMAVTRAGAGTCAELAACGVPALLVPLPSARRGHQLANARAVERGGGADVVEEKILTAPWLADHIRKCAADTGRLGAMRNALRGLAMEGAAERIADLVEQTGSAASATSACR